MGTSPLRSRSVARKAPVKVAHLQLLHYFRSPSNTMGSISRVDRFKYLFVFGDSLTSVMFGIHSPEPSSASPMGVPFPGQSYAMPNWVGYFMRDHMDPTPLVYDYAIPGARVDTVAMEVKTFLRRPGVNNVQVPWDSENSLFLTWVGTNDINYGETTMEDALRRLFNAQTRLYDTGARNFVLFNIPPFPRPQQDNAEEAAAYTNERRAKTQEWNNQLEASAADFAKTHPDATVLIFDVFGTFTHIRSDPAKYGFAPGTGSMWDRDFYLDHIHPTTAVHKVIAEELVALLVTRFGHGGMVAGDASAQEIQETEDDGRPPKHNGIRATLKQWKDEFFDRSH